ncbi:hypothetical protein B0H12DRAFT_263949 [Mycena haematopus]|nr:hypothetical protein B0H12DRAFT_263949 [Mycena haematopus]
MLVTSSRLRANLRSCSSLSCQARIFASVSVYVIYLGVPRRRLVAGFEHFERSASLWISESLIPQTQSLPFASCVIFSTFNTP